jgi:hypothetical protein
MPVFLNENEIWILTDPKEPEPFTFGLEESSPKE